MPKHKLSVLHKQTGCKRRLPFLRLTLILALLLCPFEVWGNATYTYEIRFLVFCDDPVTVCGHHSEAALEQHFRNEMYLVNEVFRPARISFRIHDFVFEYGTKYAGITGDLDNKPDEKDNVIELQEQRATEDTGRISAFVFEHLVGGFSGIPIYETRPYPTAYYGVFYGPQVAFSAIAHELGHHFCLAHPFTFGDPPEPGFAGHDGDGAYVSDTAPDPGEIEAIDRPSTATERWDIFQNGPLVTLVEGHQWCVEQASAEPLDPQSPVGRHCIVNCFTNVNNQAQPLVLNPAPQPELIMTYYDCPGPYVPAATGQRVEAFSPGQLAQIQRCIDTVPERQNYTNVCAGQGGDSDHDGLCDFNDICPQTYNDSRFDTDGDGTPDACDNCPADPNIDQADMDGDGAGDVCDHDIDGDACQNQSILLPNFDLDPFSPLERTGTTITCSGSRPTMSPTDIDSDNDGILNCAEIDNDNDGIVDSDDACPNVPGNDPSACLSFESCNVIAFEYCFFNCGIDFELRLVSRVNPADVIVFDDFRVAEGTLYLPRQQTVTTSETARLLLGEQFPSINSPGPGPDIPQPKLALEVWSRVPEQLVQVLVEYTPDSVYLHDLANGQAVAVRLGEGSSINATSAWALGIDKDAVVIDMDHDSVPDQFDNCLTQSNIGQRDSDNDGFGNACDPDFDQNGLVTQSDVDLIRNCIGVDPLFRFKVGFSEPDTISQVPSLPPVAVALSAYGCEPADINDDHVIDEMDLAVASALLGKRPGPSSLDRGLPNDVTRDTEPPVTHAQLDPDSPNDSGWYRSAVSITLIAQDAMSGVAATYYRVNGGDWLTYQGPFLVDSDSAQHVIEFYSTDIAGNTEDAKSVELKLDSTAPMLKCKVVPAVLVHPNRHFVAIRSFVKLDDALSGPAGFILTSVTSSDPGGTDDIRGFDIGTPDLTGWLRAEISRHQHTRTYTLTYEGNDSAGNTATCSVDVLVKRGNRHNDKRHQDHSDKHEINWRNNHSGYERRDH